MAALCCAATSSSASFKEVVPLISLFSGRSLGPTSAHSLSSVCEQLLLNEKGDSVVSREMLSSLLAKFQVAQLHEFLHALGKINVTTSSHSVDCILCLLIAFLLTPRAADPIFWLMIWRVASA